MINFNGGLNIIKIIIRRPNIFFFYFFLLFYITFLFSNFINNHYCGCIFIVIFRSSIFIVIIRSKLMIFILIIGMPSKELLRLALINGGLIYIISRKNLTKALAYAPNLLFLINGGLNFILIISRLILNLIICRLIFLFI